MCSNEHRLQSSFRDTHHWHIQKNPVIYCRVRLFFSLNVFFPSLKPMPCPPVPFQDSDIQKKIDHEIRMRDGACKLLAACSQKDQALEAAKSLQTCSTRIMAYMSELQRMKEAQVMQKVTRRSSDAGPLDDRLPCKGKVAISGK